jgi:hypothetical protein
LAFRIGHTRRIRQLWHFSVQRDQEFSFTFQALPGRMCLDSRTDDRFQRFFLRTICNRRRAPAISRQIATIASQHDVIQDAITVELHLMELFRERHQKYREMTLFQRCYSSRSDLTTTAGCGRYTIDAVEDNVF